MTLIVLRNSGQIFCRLSLSLYSSGGFLAMTLIYGFGGKIPEVKYPSHQAVSVGEHYHVIAADTYFVAHCSSVGQELLSVLLSL